MTSRQCYASIIVLFIALLIAAGQSAVAQNEEALPTRNDGAPVTLVSKWLSSDRADSQGVAIEEMVLDLETGHVALQIVSWKHVESAEKVYAVMPFMPHLNSEQTARIAPSMTKETPKNLNRKLAAVIYADFNRDLYWTQHMMRLLPDAHGSFDRERFELTSFKDLQSVVIEDAEGKPVGKIIDVAVDEKTAEIKYCVMQSEDEKLRAIPLGAFVKRDPKAVWKIELKREQIVNFEPFDRAQPPQTIDRGWQEYVAVRYGRDALQTKPNAEVNKEKSKPESR